MSVTSTNYRIPVQVNGFECRNCTDVDYAKRHIDPQHPQSGPYGVNAATDPSRTLDHVADKRSPPLSTTGSLFDVSA
jgi:hypothetical protein